MGIKLDEMLKSRRKLEVGSKLEENLMNLEGYTKQEELYRSSRSIIIKVMKENDPKLYVVKQPTESILTAKSRARFRYEKEIMEIFDHNGIIKLMDWYEKDNTMFILMEYGGLSLSQFMKGNGKSLELYEKIRLAIQCAEAIAHVHRNQIVHNDINPNNILIDPEAERIRIIDFGLSTLVPREEIALKNPERLEGTLSYISPEQTGRINRSVDYRSDLYSFGVVLYEMLTGERPFNSTDPMGLVHCHIAKEPVPIKERNTDIPEILSDMISKLMAKDPEERYQSAYGFQKDLEKYLESIEESVELKDFRFELGQNDIGDNFRIPERLYGREREIETLLSAFDRVAGGEAELMLVAGFSGIGKSVLVKEVYRSLTRRRGYFIAGKFDQYQKNIPYSAMVSAFRELVHQILTETSQGLESWKTRLLASLGPNGRVVAEVIPEIELIIGEQPPVPDLGPVETQNRFSYVFQKFAGVFSDSSHPLVLFLDDMQWVDSATLKLLQLLMTAKEKPWTIRYRSLSR